MQRTRIRKQEPGRSRERCGEEAHPVIHALLTRIKHVTQKLFISMNDEI